MTNEVPIIDPLGKRIYLVSEVCSKETELSEDIYNDVTAVIKKPALILEIIKNQESELYYFRSVEWDKTLLISVHYCNSRWEAYECKKNPESNELSTLLKKGKLLL